MANIFKDVLRVITDEAVITTNGIKDRMFAFARDTRKMIIRRGDVYEKIPTEETAVAEFRNVKIKEIPVSIEDNVAYVDADGNISKGSFDNRAWTVLYDGPGVVTSVPWEGGGSAEKYMAILKTESNLSFNNYAGGVYRLQVEWPGFGTAEVVFRIISTVEAGQRIAILYYTPDYLAGASNQQIFSLEYSQRNPLDGNYTDIVTFRTTSIITAFNIKIEKLSGGNFVYANTPDMTNYEVKQTVLCGIAPDSYLISSTATIWKRTDADEIASQATQSHIMNLYAGTAIGPMGLRYFEGNINSPGNALTSFTFVKSDELWSLSGAGLAVEGSIKVGTDLQEANGTIGYVGDLFRFRENGVWKSLLYNDLSDRPTLITNDATGFSTPRTTRLSYNPIARTVTLIEGTEAYYLNEPITELLAPWTSGPHAVGNGLFWLYYDDTGFHWEMTAFPRVEKTLIAAVVVRDGVIICFRECHSSTRNIRWHEGQHRNVGTYKLLEGGDYVDFILNTNTDDARRPSTGAMLIHDECVPTDIAAWPKALGYTRASLVGSELVITNDEADIIKIIDNEPYYDLNGVSTVFPNKRYGVCLQVAIPATEGVDCQKQRLIWVQPQEVFPDTPTGLANARSIISLEQVDLAQIGLLVPEIVVVGQAIFELDGNNLFLVELNKVFGSRYKQATAAGSDGLTSVSSDDTLTGSGNPADLLSVAEAVRSKWNIHSTNLEAIERNVGTVAVGDLTVMDKTFLRADEAGSGYMPTPSFGVEDRMQVMGDAVLFGDDTVTNGFLFSRTTNPTITITRSVLGDVSNLIIGRELNRGYIVTSDNNFRIINNDFTNTGLNIPTGSTYKVNGVDIASKWEENGIGVYRTTGSITVGTTPVAITGLKYQAYSESVRSLTIGTVKSDNLIHNNEFQFSKQKFTGLTTTGDSYFMYRMFGQRSAGNNAEGFRMEAVQTGISNAFGPPISLVFSSLLTGTSVVSPTFSIHSNGSIGCYERTSAPSAVSGYHGIYADTDGELYGVTAAKTSLLSAFQDAGNNVTTIPSGKILRVGLNYERGDRYKVGIVSGGSGALNSWYKVMTINYVAGQSVGINIIGTFNNRLPRYNASQMAKIFLTWGYSIGVVRTPLLVGYTKTNASTVTNLTVKAVWNDSDTVELWVMVPENYGQNLNFNHTIEQTEVGAFTVTNDFSNTVGTPTGTDILMTDILSQNMVYPTGLPSGETKAGNLAITTVGNVYEDADSVSGTIGFYPTFLGGGSTDNKIQCVNPSVSNQYEDPGVNCWKNWVGIRNGTKLITHGVCDLIVYNWTGTARTLNRGYTVYMRSSDYGAGWVINTDEIMDDTKAVIGIVETTTASVNHGSSVVAKVRLMKNLGILS